MKKQVLAVAIGISMMMAWALFKKRPAAVSADAASPEATEVTQAPAKPAGASRTTASAPTNPTSQKETAAKAGSAQPNARSQVAQKSLPAETFKDLKEFHILSSKTFLTPEEEEHKKEMLQDRGFLRKLGDLLVETQVMKDPKFEEAENAAVDLLVESLKSGDRETSLDVIQTIVRDNQVENTQLPKEIREALAGVKAELLFHAVPLAPQEFTNIASLLPGPVSQKIWQNVQAQHRQNLNESQMEVQEYQSKKPGQR